MFFPAPVRGLRGAVGAKLAAFVLPLLKEQAHIGVELCRALAVKGNGTYVTAEKKESKLQKALDAASKLIAKLKAEIDSLKQEISDYKSVHRKLRAAELERENTELRGKVRSYEDVIQRNNLWRFFHPRKEKAVTRDEAR